MATDFSFSFDRSGFKSTKEMDKKLNRAIFGVAKYWDGRCEAHMKQKAPWKDRTSNARNGLFANAAKLGDGVYAIILAHSVTYGIFLELGHSHSVALKDGGTSDWTVKPYPIIVPTMQEYGPKVIKTLNKILDRLK